MRSLTDIWRLPAGVCFTLLVVGVAACGSDTDSSTEAAVNDAGLAAAKENVAEHSKAPTEIGPSKPIGEEIPTGKKIVYINCGAESCINVGKAMDEAAEVLGWTVEHINTEPTPEAIQAAFAQAVRSNPDGVAELGFDAVTFERQLAELHEKNIPVLAATGTDPSDPDGPGIDLQVIPPDENSVSTRLLADKMIVDSQGRGEIGVVELTAFPTIKIYTEEFKKQIKQNCPECTIKSIDVQPTSIGKDAADKIANWLRANPDIEHVFLSLDDLGIGLPAAVQATGGEMPKTYGHSPSAAGIEALRTEERTAATPGPTPEVAWQFMDAFARHLTGQSMEPDQEWQGTVIWSKEFGNIPATARIPVVNDYQEQFKELWGK